MIAPQEAITTGHMFGKGIYFTDVVTKASNYCHASKENNRGVLLLCEVALGKSSKQGEAKSFKGPPQFYHSIYAAGAECPKEK